jgi:hypothetical protein
MKRTGIKWTEEENEKLLELRKGSSSNMIVRNLLNEEFGNNRTIASIEGRINHLRKTGIVLDSNRWSEEEINMATHLHKTGESVTKIVEIINDAFNTNRTYNSVSMFIHRHGLTKPSKCSYCKQHGHNKRTCSEFKEHLEVVRENETIVETIEEVVEEMEEEYVELARSSRKRWTVEEEQYMVELAYQQIPYSEITGKLNEKFYTGRSTAAIISRLSVIHSGNMRYLKKSWKDSWKERSLNRREKRIQKKILRIQNKITKLQAKVSALGAKL